MIKEGDQFPSFSLPDQDGNIVDSKSLFGERYLVYFYPKDDTSGCTLEACAFRDTFPRFKGVKVVGVSPDSSKSHKKFADKYSLPFTLVADEEQSLAEAAGVWVEKSMYGNTYMGVQRSTFLVGADGKVEKAWPKVKPEGHAEEVLAALG